MKNELLRGLPKIDEILSIFDENFLNTNGREVVLTTLREIIDENRKAILKGEVNYTLTKEDAKVECEKRLLKKKEKNLKRVINGTGVIIHTNLGRSLLSEEATYAVSSVASSYSNLEYDLEKGARGSRYSLIEEIIKDITGAEGALVVNNNASAIMLVLNSLCENKEVIVSRGQLVEIGGSFRIPDVMKFSRAKLVEVGTTNRTHIYDYEDGITEETSALLKVHSSNFKIVGFTKEVSTKELCDLGKERNIPVIEDIGSGVLIDLSKYGLEKEPTVIESLESGVDVVTFSGDKMLGGAQAGIIVGKKKFIEKIKRNQLTRALRVDKFTLAALEITLKHYLNEKEAIEKIPTLHMMTLSSEKIKKRAERFVCMTKSLNSYYDFSIEEGFSTVGGGAMPDSKLETYLVKIISKNINEVNLEKELRAYETPIITRVYNGSVYIDFRTILEKDYEVIFNALKEIGEK
ncbi:L-seryl-tRNA(Sec) selenium transferase [Clostridium sp.]|uniref:L-seryl-tRNA(Sec) selenium transferase n=1 Tax=Clostridium sp. TaxID=1506 RepID=UPI00262F6788|nr:L-seryl-tRNA(Sec) selenium transferase [Clostridium sp.]